MAARRSKWLGLVNAMIHGRTARWGAGILTAVALIGPAAALTSCEQKPHRIGSVNTEFKLIGPDHRGTIAELPTPSIAAAQALFQVIQHGPALIVQRGRVDCCPYAGLVSVAAE